MDLHRRLQDSHRSESIIGRAISMRGKAPREDQPEPGPRDVEIGVAVRALLKELDGEQHPGIVSPSQLFSLFHRHLQVERGAFLVFDPVDEAFQPIATVGLDETSRFRLRLDDAILGDLRLNPRVRVLDRTEREKLRQVLSSGDYRRSPRIAVFPFVHLQHTLAILMIFDSPVLDLDRTVLDVLLAALSDRAGRLLFDGREKPLARRAKTTVFTPEHLQDTLARITRRAEEVQQEVSCVEVGLSPILQAVSTAHPHLDTNRLLTDILTTVALLTGLSWITVQQPGVRVYLIGLAGPGTDVELLVHLLGTTLRQLFGIGNAAKLHHVNRTVEELRGEART